MRLSRERQRTDTVRLQELFQLRHGKRQHTVCSRATQSCFLPSAPMASEVVLLRNLGKRIRELRTSVHWSQEALAEAADIHENHVRRIEGGTANPSYLVLGR